VPQFVVPFQQDGEISLEEFESGILRIKGMARNWAGNFPLLGWLIGSPRLTSSRA
jgi:hypothetical protein